MNSIYTLPWPEIAELLNNLLDRRAISKRDFAIILGEWETSVNKWLNLKREPGRDKILKMIFWYQHNLALQDQFDATLRADTLKTSGDWAPMVPLIHLN